MKFGETCKAAALLSKLPLTLSSGSQAAASMLRPSRSRTGVTVLAAIETSQCHAPRIAHRRRAVDLVLEPRHELGGRVGIRTLRTSRRHQTAAQLADHFLGNFGALVRRVEIQRRQRQAADLSRSLWHATQY
jgi:hypothetical protein